MIFATSLAALCLASPIAPSSSELGPPMASVAAPHAASPRFRALDAEELAATLASDAPLGDRIAAAQSLEALGSKAAKAVPTMILTLASPEPMLVDAVIPALHAVGKKARVPLEEVFASGSYDGTEIPATVTARALLGLGKKATGLVEDHMGALPMGPERLGFIEALDEAGLPFAIEAIGAGDAALDLDIVRSIRRLAAAQPRTEDGLAPHVKKMKDKELKALLGFSWLQSPTREDVEVLTGWLASEAPMFVETGLWGLGLMGPRAASSAVAMGTHLGSDHPSIRATTAWALARLVDTEPVRAVEGIPGSFPGASASAQEAINKALEDQVFLLWRDHAKSLGYRGRIGEKAREFWSLAPAWTGQRTPLPAAVDRAKLPADLLAAEAKLMDLARSGEGLDASLASDALAALGCVDPGMVEHWIQWLASEDKALVRAALVGLRPIGRGVIEHEATIIGHLEDPVTMVPAAQVLTAIATPTSWQAVTKQFAFIEGKPPLAMMAAISRYDVTALRPAFEKMQELYADGHYLMSALLIKFGAEAVPIFEQELKASLADRRMVAVESLGHIGPEARDALPKIKALKERNPIAQKLITDAIKRIQ